MLDNLVVPAQDPVRRSQSMNSAALHAALRQKLTRLQGLEINGSAAGGNSSHHKGAEAKKKASLAATEALNQSFDSLVSAVPSAVGVPGALSLLLFRRLSRPGMLSYGLHTSH